MNVLFKSFKYEDIQNPNLRSMVEKSLKLKNEGLDPTISKTLNIASKKNNYFGIFVDKENKSPLTLFEYYEKDGKLFIEQIYKPQNYLPLIVKRIKQIAKEKKLKIELLISSKDIEKKLDIKEVKFPKMKDKVEPKTPLKVKKFKSPGVNKPKRKPLTIRRPKR